MVREKKRTKKGKIRDRLEWGLEIGLDKWAVFKDKFQNLVRKWQLKRIEIGDDVYYINEKKGIYLSGDFYESRVFDGVLSPYYGAIYFEPKIRVKTMTAFLSDLLKATHHYLGNDVGIGINSTSYTGFDKEIIEIIKKRSIKKGKIEISNKQC